VAIKIIDVEQGKKDYVMKNLTREAKVLSMLQHPSIVRLYETIRVCWDAIKLRENFDD
jgi:serine/threonine protein kinase